MKEVASLRAFLLGKLTEPERDAVEERLLAEDSFFELLLAVEEELIDECLKGELSADEAATLKHYVSCLPDGRARLAFARGLNDALTATPARERAFPWSRVLAGNRLAWAAGLSLFLFGGLAASALWTLTARVENGGVQTPSFTLTAGTLRSAGGMQTVRVGAGQSVVLLSLDLQEEGFDTYRTVLYDVDGRERLRVSGLTSTSSKGTVHVSVALPVVHVATGDYYLSLTGNRSSQDGELLARYDFRIILE